MTKIKYAWFFSLLFFSYSAFAASTPFSSEDSLTHFEISAAVGPNWTHANNTHLVISDYETDSVLVYHVSKSTLWKIGAGYHFFARQLRQRNFLNDLLLELNLCRSSETVRGEVWQYQLPMFNNYNFSAPITSTRLMLDIKPSLFAVNNISLYPILGLGAAWNNISYHENVTGDGVDPDSYHSLSSRIHTNFAYDLGAGICTSITTHLNASLEYVYTNLGSISSSGTPRTIAALISPPKFKIYSQSVLLGLIWKI